MKQLKKQTFGVCALTQAVALGLMMVSGEAVASSGVAGGGTARPLTSVVTVHESGGGKYQNIGDLEIYQAAQGSKTTITMMLDISGSMNARDDQTCKGGEAPVAKVYYLEDHKGTPLKEIIGDDGTTKIDVSKGVKVINECPSALTRIERLKQAMIELVHKEGVLNNDLSLGLGTYPHRYNSFTGSIFVPAKPLTHEQRWNLMRYVSTLGPTGATPAAQAYVEAGAYMLGTKTANTVGPLEKRIHTVGRMKIDNSQFQLLQCNTATLNAQYWNGGWVNTIVNKYTLGSDNYDWYQCNEASDARFPSFDHDMATLSGSTQATIIPDNVKKLDFTLFPKFDVVVGESNHSLYVFPIRKMSNYPKPNTPTTADGWRSPAGQFSGDYRFGEIVEYRRPSIGNSGFPFSYPSTKKKNDKGEVLDTYEAGIKDPRQCDGYGIYFLTDGEPNNANNDANDSANLSLGKTGRYIPTVSDAEFPRGASSSGFWTTIASYAKDLRSGNNPMGVSIKTATVGFGNGFVKNGKAVPVTGQKITIAGVERDIVDCSRMESQDAKNLCKWGEYTYGYGEGGFLATSSAEAIKQSVIAFSQSLNQSISTAPVGTISVPKDPLSINNIQPYAYLPMLEPKVAENPTVWRGNLKKYHTLNGTLYGKGNPGLRLYEKATNATDENKNYPSQFNRKAMDIWQAKSEEDNSSIDVGGSKEYLQKLTNDATRSVYLENYTNFDLKTYQQQPNRQDYMRANNIKDKQLVKVSLIKGVLSGIENLKSPYTLEDKKAIVAYLGVNVGDTVRIGGRDVPVTEANLVQATKAAYDAGRRNDKPVLGGVVHSVPVLATYGGQFEGSNISSNEDLRDDALLYGSMDGALHMIGAKDATERFAFIPRAIFEDTEQRQALYLGSSRNKVGEPVFGVDAPWVTSAEYTYHFSNDDGSARETATVSAEHVYAYGGLRMGGNGIFGLDISNVRRTTDGKFGEPSLLFSINRWTPGFSRLGQTWVKPIVAKIKTADTNDALGARALRDVVIFGGGYDMCYEHPKFRVGLTNSTHTLDSAEKEMSSKQFSQYANGNNSCAKEKAQGNGVYMVDAKTGALLAAWTGDTIPEMKDSVVGEITVLDRNNNGAADHLYFGDLGGKVWRVDLKEGINPGGYVPSIGGDFIPNHKNNITRRVVKVLDANADKTSSDHVPYRFYDQPLVSFHDHAGKTFAVVNIASGDRSSPVHQHRKQEDSNRIFGFFDRDLATTRLDRSVEDPNLITKDLTVANLIKVDPKEVNKDTAGKTGQVSDYALEQMKHLKDAVANQTAKTKFEGWYYDMNRFDGYTGVPNLKSMGAGMVVGNVYYANVYSPDYEYTTANTCTARVSGGTERQLYCLPWGICADDNGKTVTANGVLGYLKAGPGIQELALGTATNTAGKSTAYRTILGAQSLSEIAEEHKDTKQRPGTTGGDSAAFAHSGVKVAGGQNEGGHTYSDNLLTAPKYTLAVQRWYDLQNENQANQ